MQREPCLVGFFPVRLVGNPLQKSHEHVLRAALQQGLRGGTSVVLASVSAEGAPSTALLSWVVATSSQSIALALDVRGAGYANILAGRNLVALEVLDDDMVLSVRGRARIRKERLKSVPFPCALATIDVLKIRDHTLSGVRFQAPRYLFADDKKHRREVEHAIFAELIEL